MKYHLTLPRMIYIKRIKTINVKDMEKMEHICTVDENINWFIFLANGIDSF